MRFPRKKDITYYKKMPGRNTDEIKVTKRGKGNEDSSSEKQNLSKHEAILEVYKITKEKMNKGQKDQFYFFNSGKTRSRRGASKKIDLDIFFNIKKEFGKRG